MPASTTPIGTPQRYAIVFHNPSLRFSPNPSLSMRKPIPLLFLLQWAYQPASFPPLLFYFIGLTYVIKRSDRLNPAAKLIIQRFVPLPATSLASTLNVLCMRGPELKTGIDVFDESGNRIGTSKVAAKQAVLETALTRAFLPIPILLFPPIIMPFLERFIRFYCENTILRLKFVQKSAARHLIVNAVVCTICFGLSLPVALALFPQQSSVSFLCYCWEKVEFR